MLASIVDNLQQGKLSPLTLMQRAQKLPLRYRYLTDKVIKARRNGDFRFKEISLGESTFKKGSSHSLGNGNECRGYISLTGPMQKEPNEDSAQMKELLQQRYRLKRFGGHDRLMQQKFHQQHYRIERPGGHVSSATARAAAAETGGYSACSSTATAAAAAAAAAAELFGPASFCKKNSITRSAASLFQAVAFS